MPAGRFLEAGGTEGCPADLARSTAEGVGGFAATVSAALGGG